MEGAGPSRILNTNDPGRVLIDDHSGMVEESQESLESGAINQTLFHMTCTVPSAHAILPKAFLQLAFQLKQPIENVRKMWSMHLKVTRLAVPRLIQSSRMSCQKKARELSHLQTFVLDAAGSLTEVLEGLSI